MRITIILVHFIFSTILFAQNNVQTDLNEKKRNYLLNYIPNKLKADTIHDVESRFLKSRLNTIGTLQIFSGIRREMNLSDSDNDWLNKRIEKLANELFSDGKRILIKPVGGYAGCPDELIDSLIVNDIQITVLKFCHSCKNSKRDKSFITLFNNKMYTLMEIDPQNEYLNALN